MSILFLQNQVERVQWEAWPHEPADEFAARIAADIVCLAEFISRHVVSPDADALALSICDAISSHDPFDPKEEI